MPAARSNAIGVQTLYLAEPFAPDWVHVYWFNQRMGESDVPNSYRLNTAIPDLWPFVTGRGFITRLTERFAVDWWRENRLIESKKPRLRRMLGDVGFAYLAPIMNSDATRCRSIVESLGCPFVVHIWDFLDLNLNADYHWLFSQAEHVFCLSPTMIEEVSVASPSKISLLPFTRPPAQRKAKYLGTDTLKIGLVGTLATYVEGVELLSDAISQLSRQFADIRIVYMGLEQELKFIPQGLKPFVEYAGLLGLDRLDLALSDCNVAYLPGPLLAPEIDARSRHSIPSRSADFTSIGLPMIAALHPRSATSVFFSSLQDRGLFLVSNPEEICRAAQQLRDEVQWNRSSSECLAFFDAHFDKGPVQQALVSVAQPFLSK
jgi:hypothetical protein